MNTSAGTKVWTIEQWLHGESAAAARRLTSPHSPFCPPHTSHSDNVPPVPQIQKKCSRGQSKWNICFYASARNAQTWTGLPSQSADLLNFLYSAASNLLSASTLLNHENVSCKTATSQAAHVNRQIHGFWLFFKEHWSSQIYSYNLESWCFPYAIYW